MEQNTKNEELALKEYLSERVYNCISKLYQTGKYGYLTMIGGEAINMYLNKNEKLQTGDFDIKFVVNPEFANDESDLYRANSLRLRLTQNIFDCISNMPPPKGYEYIKPLLGILIRQKFHQIYLDDGKMFFVDNFTGEEKFTKYRPNKTFKIILQYKKSDSKTTKSKTDVDSLKHFDLIDIGLFYPKKLAYTYFEDKIYATFLNPPFNNKVPIPYVVRDNIRIPTLPFLLFDNFRMALISLDNLSIHRENEDLTDFWKKKLTKYWSKINTMLTALKRKNEILLVENIQKKMNITYSLYEPLAFFNMVCFKNGKTYTKEILNKDECDENYVSKLDEFKKAYYEVARLTSKLRF